MWKGVLGLAFFPYRGICVLPVQYVLSMAQFVHHLTRLSCLLEIMYLLVAGLTCASIERFEQTSVSPADESSVRKEQYSLRNFVSGNHFPRGLNEAFKTATFYLQGP